MAAHSHDWTLTRVARALGEPQHRLIYFCEHDVVRPDHRDARGRGSSRVFSARNVLEFAVALRLRDLQIPVSALRALLRALRGFEEAAKAKEPEFELPKSLRERDPPEVRVVIGDGRYLYVSVAYRGRGPVLISRTDLQSVDDGEPALATLEAMRPPLASGSIGPEGSRHWRLEVSVTSIARDLPVGD